MSKPAHPHNYLSVNKKTAINSYGDYLSIGDSVTHEGNEEVLVIERFFIDEESNEIKAVTSKGSAAIDFLNLHLF